MNIPLRKKHRTLDGIHGFKAKPRTGNSHGGEKGRKKNGKTNEGPSRYLRVDGATGKSVMVVG